jgi:(S)-2-hydroxy-acid oxidase
VLENNRNVFNSLALRQRAINAPQNVDTKTTVLGEPLSAPVIMSAMTMPIPAMAPNGLFKGVLSREDAAFSLDAGADAIMVSNHGAHTIDYLPHPLQVLTEISQVVRGRIPIFVDGGFRRGADVFKALALGADLVGLGRPILYGLAAEGEDGVFHVLAQISLELKRVMTMTGVDRVEKITSDSLIDLHKNQFIHLLPRKEECR